MPANHKYRLALDVGSKSLGWAVFRLNDDNAPCAIFKAGVRIFSDGRHPKTHVSLAVERRLARSMRRMRDRKLYRKHQMIKRLVRYGFFPQDPQKRKALETLNPYELRAKGLEQQLRPEEFARAVFHLQQRRGFKSNRKAGNSSDGLIANGIQTLATQMQQTGCRTVGEYFFKVKMQGNPAGVRGQTVRAKINKVDQHEQYDQYVSRDMIQSEFEALWSAQAQYAPQLFTAQAHDALLHTLLFQRPLRPKDVGRCTLLPDQPRAAVALPSTQRFRMLQEVNNLRYSTDDLHVRPLTLHQRDTVMQLLELSRKVSFKAIAKALQLPPNTTFNLEDERRTELLGNQTSATLASKKLLGKQWLQLPHDQQERIVHLLLTEESEGVVVSTLQAMLGIDAQAAQALSQTQLSEGHSRLSSAAIARIVPQLQADVITYDKAVIAAGFEHHSALGWDFEFDDSEVVQLGTEVHPLTGEITPKLAFKQLPYYGRVLPRHVAFGSGNSTDIEEKRYGKIANPTVHVALNQTRKVVNAIIARYGRPTEVVIELARDLAMSAQQKWELKNQQKDKKNRNDKVREEIAQLLGIQAINVKRDDVQKWLLWEELSPNACDRRCPYTGTQISASMLLSDLVEIEHILPFSQTLDNSMSNRTVALREANRIKGNRTPWEAKDDFEARGWSAQNMLAIASTMPQRKAYRFGPNAMQQWQSQDMDFLARALNDTRYIARLVAMYLRFVCPGSATRSIPGHMTALLRQHMGVNNVLSASGKKNRDDHRHHAVDACIIGITDQGMLQRFATANARAREQGLTKLVTSIDPPWESFQAHVQRAINSIWVSHKPERSYKGQMLDGNAYGFDADGQIKQKKGKKNKVKAVIPIRDAKQLQRHGVDEQGQPKAYKGYRSSGNFALEITKNAKGKWESHIISTYEAYQIEKKHGEQRLRHPKLAQNGQPLVMRLHKDDTLRLDHDGRTQVVRMKAIATSGQFLMTEHHTANSVEQDSNDDRKVISKTVLTLQKSNAVKVVINEIGDLRVLLSNC